MNTERIQCAEDEKKKWLGVCCEEGLRRNKRRRIGQSDMRDNDCARVAGSSHMTGLWEDRKWLGHDRDCAEWTMLIGYPPGCGSQSKYWDPIKPLENNGLST